MDTVRTDQDSRMPFALDRGISGRPVSRRSADRRDVDRVEHRGRFRPGHQILSVRPDELDLTFHGNPVPSGPKHHGCDGAGSQVDQLQLLTSLRHEPDDTVTGGRVVDQSRIDHRCVTRSIRTDRHGDRMPTLASR